ncbi:MAG TPA: isoprenylcysteine carboxylmethyltransferase family protein [Planktothrix sp.]|jgi:protein-S-isoprenylcysteine O-methyltransferase Ste14
MSVRIRYIIFSYLLFIVLAIIIGLLASTFNLPWFWAVFVVESLIGSVSIFKIDDDLLAERAKPAGKDEDPHATKILSALFIAHFVLAALDVGRWHLSNTVPVPLQVIGLICVALGWSGLMWAMITNRYFSSAIRLQDDRGQHVVMSGPYKYVRHPGYATASIAFIGQALALGSWIALVPMVLVAVIMFKRTLQEEQLLSAKLPGYREYQTLVPYRWCPGVW